MITLSSLPLAAGKQADFTPSDIIALLTAYKTAAAGGAAVGTDAVTLAFANAMLTYVSNRFGVMAEITQTAATAFAAPGSPDTANQLDDHGHASAELVDNGVAATPTF
jgi:hypothetical protein